MPKTAIAIVLAGFVLAAAGSASATAMQIVPFSKSVMSNLNGDVLDVGWRRCWRDRWGRMALHMVLARSVGPRSLPVTHG